MNTARSHWAVAAFQKFVSLPLDALLAPMGEQEPAEAALTLFHTVAATVPAYKTFLAEHDLDPASIRNIEDFPRIPPITKQNYLLRHPLPALCRDGRLESCDMIAVSSGSTGKPCFWPRFLTDELHIATRFEQIFHDSFHADTRRTLAVVCFTLGTWVGGMYTANCCRHLAAKGYPITVITPGNNREEIFRVVQELGPLYEQVVLLGYPPFLKGIIDEGKARGMDWSAFGIKWVTAGEVFSEEWRALVGERVGATEPYSDSAALYGTADAGVLGNETPLSLCIRRWLAANPDAARQLCGESRLPTLVQYDPFSRYFEARDGGLLFSGDNGIPLLRYDILDTGGLLPYEALLDFLRDWNFNPLGEFAPHTRGIRPLPFVYVFGRSDFTLSFYGANIYPENVTVGLEQEPVKAWVTGKFVLQIQEDADRNPRLAVVVELAPNMQSSAAKEKVIAQCIKTHLLRLNSEFANYVPPLYQTPQVTLTPMGHPEYFPVGVKHRYTRK